MRMRVGELSVCIVHLCARKWTKRGHSFVCVRYSHVNSCFINWKMACETFKACFEDRTFLHSRWYNTFSRKLTVNSNSHFVTLFYETIDWGSANTNWKYIFSLKICISKKIIHFVLSSLSNKLILLIAFKVRHLIQNHEYQRCLSFEGRRRSFRKYLL